VRRAADGLDNAVAAGLMTEDFARNARADFTDVTDAAEGGRSDRHLSDVQPILRAAQQYRIHVATGNFIMTIAVILARSRAFWGCARPRISAPATWWNKAIRRC
jgi:phosphate transport system permease protein